MVESQRLGIGQQVAVEGRAGIGYPGEAIYVVESATYHNSAADAQQTIAIAVGTPANDTVYTVQVNQHAVTINSGTGGAGNTDASVGTIAAQLVTGLYRNGDISSRFIPVATATGLTLTHRYYGISERVSVSGGGAGFVATDNAAALTGIIPYGLAVVRASGATSGRPNCALPNAAGQAVVGFTYAAAGIPREPDSTQLVNGLPGFRRSDPVTVVTKGNLYCLAESAITAGSALFKRHTADGTLTQPGALAGAGGAGLDAVTNAIAEEDSFTLGNLTVVAVSVDI